MSTRQLCDYNKEKVNFEKLDSTTMLILSNHLSGCLVRSVIVFSSKIAVSQSYCHVLSVETSQDESDVV